MEKLQTILNNIMKLHSVPNWSHTTCDLTVYHLIPDGDEVYFCSMRVLYLSYLYIVDQVAYIIYPSHHLITQALYYLTLSQERSIVQ